MELSPKYIKQVSQIVWSNFYYTFLLNNIKYQKDFIWYEEFKTTILNNINNLIKEWQYINYIRIAIPEAHKDYWFKSKFVNFSNYFILKSNYYNNIKVNENLLPYVSTVHFRGRKNIYQYLINNNVSIEIVELFEVFWKKHKNNEINKLLKKEIPVEAIAKSMNMEYKNNILPIIKKVVDKFIENVKTTKLINNYENIIQLVEKEKNTIIKSIWQYILNWMVLEFKDSSYLSVLSQNIDSAINEMKHNWTEYYNKYLVTIKTDQKIIYIAYVNWQVYTTAHDIPEYMQFIYEDIFLRQIFNSIYTNKALIKKISLNNLALFGFYPMVVFEKFLKEIKYSKLDWTLIIIKRIKFILKLIKEKYDIYPDIFLNLWNKVEIRTDNTPRTFLISYWKKYYEIKPISENSNNLGDKITEVEAQYIPIVISKNNYIINMMFLNQVWQYIHFDILNNLWKKGEKTLLINKIN